MTYGDRFAKVYIENVDVMLLEHVVVYLLFLEEKGAIGRGVGCECSSNRFVLWDWRFDERLGISWVKRGCRH